MQMSLGEWFIGGVPAVIALVCGLIAYGKMGSRIDALKERVDGTEALNLGERMTALEKTVDSGVREMLLRMAHLSELLGERAKNYAAESRVDQIDSTVEGLRNDLNSLYKYSHESRHEIAGNVHAIVSELESRMTKIEAGCEIRHRMTKT